MENSGDHNQLPPSYSQSLPLPSYSQPLPLSSYSQPLPLPSYSQPLPLPSYSQQRPLSSYSQPMPLPSYSQPLPLPSYSQPRPLSSYSQPLPLSSYSQPLPLPSYSQPLPLPSQQLPLPLQVRKHWLEQIGNASDDGKYQFPRSRIKKIMKSDPKVHMVAAEAPILLSKAIEMFIVDLTTQSWLHTEEERPKMIQKSNISNAVSRSCVFDFLADVFARDQSVAAAAAGSVAMSHQDDGVLPREMVIGVPIDNCNGMYQPTPQTQEAAVPSDEEKAVWEVGGGSGGN